jgi:hypothetical protein
VDDNGPNPMEILRRISPAGARTYMEHRSAIMDIPELWTKPARAAGVSDAEIVEAILTARLMKAATVNDAAATALDWLLRSG